MRLKRNLMRRFKLIWVVQSPYQKYSACAVGQITSTDSRVPPRLRGALRDRHERWVRDAVDVVARETNVASADGKAVWS